MMKLSPRLKFLLIGSAFILIFSCTLRRSHAQSSSNSNVKLTGESYIVSNYIEKGITQSEKNPALQAAVAFHLHQGRVGLWAASVRYPGTDESIKLKVPIGFLFDWTQNFKTYFEHSYIRHIGGTARDGLNFLIHFMIFDYNFYIETEDNFESSGDKRTWYGFTKSWKTIWDLELLGKGGYSIVESDQYSSYFDIDISTSYAYSNFSGSFGITYASNANEFGSRASPFYYIKVGVAF